MGAERATDSTCIWCIGNKLLRQTTVVTEVLADICAIVVGVDAVTRFSGSNQFLTFVSSAL